MSEGDLEKAPPPIKEEQIELDEVKIKDDSPPVAQTDEPVDVEIQPKTVKKPWWKKKGKEDADEDAIPPATLKEVFSFATPIDCFFMITAILAAFALGCALPAAMLVFGDLLNAFINQQFTQYAVDTVSGLNVTSYMQNNTIIYSSSSPGFSCEVYSDAIERYAAIDDSTCVPFSSFNTSLPTSPLTLNVNPVECSALGSIVALFFGSESSCTTDDEFINSINIYCYYFIGLAVVAILIGYYIEAVFQVTAERQIYKIRLAYYKSVMKQDIAWFDVNASGEVASRLVDDLDKVQTGIGEKFVILFQWVGSLICGFTIGFVRDWRLTLALLSITPFLAAGGALMTIVTTRFTSAEQKAYATAGALAEEVLSSIKTVIAFGGEYKESERYTTHLRSARSSGIKKGLGLGLSLGYVFFLIFSAYAIAFWFGGWLISEGLTQGGQVLTVFFCVFIAAFSIGQAGPYMEALSTALGAAGAIFDIIKREPPIDSSSTEGVVLSESEPATIHFKDVNFSYPTRPDVQVLKSFSLSVDVGQTVALVGHSGCGKSTIVQLLQRFYDIEEGEIKIASHSIKDLNITSLHDAIGVVSQEPVLFDTTILDNIRYAKDGATQEEIEAAAKTANVHQFISELPDGYNTLVGEGGTQLSGGQKQRIAIARALIRNPKILLLDEATSALDSESESLVQSALEKASLERTTIVIAHRLSTIRNADLIVCLDNGEIKETGTHDELMKLEGLYYDMVTSQTQGAIDDAYLSIEQESSAETKGPAVLPFSKQYSKQVSRQFSRQASTSDDKKEKKTRTEMLKKKQEEWDKDLPEISLGRILKLNAKEWWLLALGVLGAAVQGSIFPLFAIIFGEALKAFSAEQDQVLNEVHLPAGLFLALAFVSALAVFFKTFCFAISGEKLTSRIRSITFKAMLRKDMSWFDEEKNSTGALTTRLAEDAALIQGATGLRLATLIETLISLLCALGIALAYSWIMTILILGFAPFLVIVGAARAMFYRQHLSKNKGAFAHAGKLVVDSLENIRTVTALNLQNKFAELYEVEIRKPYKTSILFHHVEGVAYGMSQGMIFFGYALAFRFGAFLVTLDDDHILHAEFQDLFRVLFAIIFGAFAVGQASTFAPDYTKARVAANRVFALLDHTPIIDNYSTEGQQPEMIEGEVALKEVSFNYPSRPDVPVLQEISISVQPGQTVALVGPSGCGKSTVVSLIERFYDVLKGSVLLDKVDLRDLNIRWLRGQVGIVSQEPVLFNTSIADNIKYGANHRKVSDEEIIEAAKAANIHDFIQSLPQGYSTSAGDKGTQLSGGQKQRIAIARALIRNPKILLLDEATSALDSESERVVQEALDKAREGRTCIVIAHRLSTIYNADNIIVITRGAVVETGTHTELLASGGLYSQLHQRQQLNTKD